MRAWAAAMRKSHASASSAPPPSASPLRAAITGMRSRLIRSSVVRMVRAICAACSAERMYSSSLRSPPAQKALSPARRMTSTRARFEPTSSSARPSERMVARFIALRAWGRSIAIVATPPRIWRVKPSNVAGAAGLAPAAALFCLLRKRGRESAFKQIYLEGKRTPALLTRLILRTPLRAGSRRSRAMRENRRMSLIFLASSAWPFQSRFGHLAEVEHLGQRRLRDAAPAGQLSDRAPGADRFLGDLRRLVVTDDRVERGGKHRAALDQLGSAVGGLQSLDAARGEVARGRREQRDQLESLHAGHGHQHVQFEHAARLTADQ